MLRRQGPDWQPAEISSVPWVTLPAGLESGGAAREAFPLATGTRPRPNRHSCPSHPAGSARRICATWALGRDWGALSACANSMVPQLGPVWRQWMIDESDGMAGVVDERPSGHQMARRDNRSPRGENQRPVHAGASSAPPRGENQRPMSAPAPPPNHSQRAASRCPTGAVAED